MFVYIYSSWCSRSIKYAEKVVQRAAIELQSTIKFVAVNCFNKDGVCSKHFKLYRYPSILFYVRNSGFFNYNGPVEYNYLLKFLNLLILPLQRIDSYDEFMQNLIENEVNIVLKNFYYLIRFF